MIGVLWRPRERQAMRGGLWVCHGKGAACGIEHRNGIYAAREKHKMQQQASLHFPSVLGRIGKRYSGIILPRV